MRMRHHHGYHQHPQHHDDHDHHDIDEEDCDEIVGDEIERGVSWKRDTDLGQLAGRIIRLRFGMKDADLFSFQFRD